jgi:4-carboxymuconolactone decarboxylase
MIGVSAPCEMTRAVRTVDDGRRHVLKPLAGPDVRSSVRRDSLDLWNTSLDMGVTVLMARPKASSGPPDMLGHHTAKPLVGETTMNADALPPDIDPASRCRLPLPNRDDLDEAGQQTFDLLSDPHGGSLAGLRGPGGLRLHSPMVSAGLRPVNTYLRYAAGINPRLRELAILVTVREHDCQFAWAAHEGEARREGLSAEVIDIIRHRRPTDGLAEAEAALIDFGRELFGTHRVTPQTYARVAVLFERRMLVDLVNLMGMYAATAAMLIAFDAQLPEGVTPGLPPR